MRKMREPGFFRWHHVLFAVPAIALAFGIQYFMRKSHPESRTDAELSFVTKPSFFKADSGPVASAQSTPATRALANSKGAEADRKHGDWEAVEKAEDIAKKSMTVAKAAPAGITGGRAALVGASKEDMPLKTQHFATRSEASKSANAVQGDSADANANPNAVAALANPNSCMSVEYRGDGPNSVITAKDWARTIDQFLEAKKDLGRWLDQHRKGFPDRVVAAMESQLRAVKVEKPVVADELDLSWRGIGVWSLDKEKSPVVRLSPGFVKLAVRQPERAKFEMARLIAQSWAPCELQRHESLDAWGPLLSCLGVKESTACSNGSTSEAGWAVSSTVAAIVAPPGCTLPAFNQAGMSQCLKKMPLPLNMAGGGIEISKPLWKVAQKESGNKETVR